MRTICTATENKYSIEYFYGFVRYFVFALLYVFAGKSTVRNNADNYADLSNGLAVLGYLLVEYAVYNGMYVKGQYLATFLYLWKYMAAWAVLYLEYEILGIRNRLSMVLIAGFFSRYLVRMIVTGKPEIMMFTGDIIFWFVSFVLYVIVWWNEDEISTNWEKIRSTTQVDRIFCAVWKYVRSVDPHPRNKEIHHNKVAYTSQHNKDMEYFMGTKVFMFRIEDGSFSA